MLKIKCTEDEMVTFHENGEFAFTLYASCPEQAYDLAKKWTGRLFADRDEVLTAYSEFDGTWKSKHEEEL